MMKYLLGGCTLTFVSARLNADTFQALVLYEQEFSSFSTIMLDAQVSGAISRLTAFNTLCPDTTINCSSAPQLTQDNCCGAEDDDDNPIYGCGGCWPNLNLNTTAATFVGPVVCTEAVPGNEIGIVQDGLKCMTSGMHTQELRLTETVNIVIDADTVEETDVFTNFNRTELYAAVKLWAARPEAAFLEFDTEFADKVSLYLLEEMQIFRSPLVQAGVGNADNAAIKIETEAGQAGHLFEPINHGALTATGAGEVFILRPTSTGPIIIKDSVSAAIFGGSNSGTVTSTTTGHLVVANLVNSGDIVISGSTSIWLKDLVNSGVITATNIEADVQNTLNTGTVTVNSGIFVATGIDNSGGIINIDASVTTCDITFITGKVGTLNDPGSVCTKTEAAAPIGYAPGGTEPGGTKTPPYSAAGTTVPAIVSGLVLANLVAL